MTSKEIEETLRFWHQHPNEDMSAGVDRRVHWEIALQLALYNEHCARLEARYMELTAVAVKRKPGVGSRESGAERQNQKAPTPKIHHS